MIKSRPSIPAPKKARGAKEMAESDKIPQIDPTEIEILIQKIEQNKLDEGERRLIVALLRTFLYIVALLQEKKITLLKIKDMIFGRKSEKNKKEKETAEGGLEGSGDGEQRQEPKNEKQESDGAVCAPDKRGHGRNPVSAYPGAKKVRCRHRELQSGHDCPERLRRAYFCFCGFASRKSFTIGTIVVIRCISVTCVVSGNMANLDAERGRRSP